MGKLRKFATAGVAAAAAYTVYRARYKRREKPVETFVDDVNRVAEQVENSSLTDSESPLSAEEDRYGGNEEE